MTLFAFRILIVPGRSACSQRASFNQTQCIHVDCGATKRKAGWGFRSPNGRGGSGREVVWDTGDTSARKPGSEDGQIGLFDPLVFKALISDMAVEVGTV